MLWVLVVAPIAQVRPVVRVVDATYFGAESTTTVKPPAVAMLGSVVESKLWAVFNCPYAPVPV